MSKDMRLKKNVSHDYFGEKSHRAYIQFSVLQKNNTGSVKWHKEKQWTVPELPIVSLL